MIKHKEIEEGITDVGSPDMKYYAFDWDDNILIMPTKIILKDDNGNDVGMSTEDFAKYRDIVGVEPFEYDGHKIVNYSEKPFINFGSGKDKEFLIESMLAKPGPAWGDFVEAINNGSIFSIITARGHSPNTLKESCYNLIISNKNGIDSDELVRNLIKFREITGEEITNKKQMIKEYLDLCKFYPVSYGGGSEKSPEVGKIQAMENFINYIKKVSSKIHKKAFLKNKVSNKFIPQIGFSDDDIKNIEFMKKHFKDEPILKTYSTTGGIKKKY